MFEIGDSLREARTRRSVALGQAEQATKIRAKYLRALEDEQFDQLPTPTYVKGFLRTYADYLGLDGQLYVDEYNSRFVSGEDWEGPRRSRARAASRSRRVETSIVMVALGLIAVVTVIVISAGRVSSGGSKPPQRPPHHPSALAATRAASTPAPYLRIVALKGDSYVEVFGGGPTGQVLFQGTLDRGAILPFRGKSFWLNLSSPENLEVSVGGKPVTLAGNRPETLTVTPHGAHPD